MVIIFLPLPHYAAASPTCGILLIVYYSYLHSISVKGEDIKQKTVIEEVSNVGLVENIGADSRVKTRFF